MDKLMQDAIGRLYLAGRISRRQAKSRLISRANMGEKDAIAYLKTLKPSVPHISDRVS